MIDLYNGDCLEIMDRLIEKGIIVDAIITDPPYGTTACKWDTIIPFEEMWLRLNKLIKPNGAIVLFGSEPFSSALRMSNIKNYKYDWVWEKGRASGFQHSKNKPMKAHENILVFSDGVTVHASQSKRRMPYFPQMEEGKPYTKEIKTINTGKINHAPSKGNLDFIGTTLRNKGERFPRSVIKFNIHNVGLSHPTQKPIKLMEYLIKTYTNENELVLDFTCGSGSTLVGCLNTNRRGIGIEQDDKYFEIAKERIG